MRLAQPNGVLGEPRFYSLGLRPMGKVVADVNGDGIPDLVTADFTPYISVHLGLGNGEFGPARKAEFRSCSHFGTDSRNELAAGERRSQLFSVEAADFDHDGKLDLAVGFWDCRIGFFKGDGTGAFTFTHAHVLFREPRGLTAGDFDGDGDMTWFAPRSITSWLSSKIKETSSPRPSCPNRFSPSTWPIPPRSRPIMPMKIRTSTCSSLGLTAQFCSWAGPA